MTLNQQLALEVAGARRTFDAACSQLRPELHRFCTRMTGNPCDGEDVLQDTLVLAFYRFPELRELGAFRGWMFRIAHNKCIDFLRGKKRFEGLDAELITSEEGAMEDALDHKQRAERALSRIASGLPPKERACVVLKDVLDWSLEETAEVTGSSVGAVKAALHRAREKLEQAEQSPPLDQARLSPENRALVQSYLTAFNRRDWDGVSALLSEDARLEVVHRGEGPFRDACYFINYSHLSWSWKLELCTVDGQETIVHFREIDGKWRPHSVVQLGIADGAVQLVRDYVHVDYLLFDSVVGD